MLVHPQKYFKGGPVQKSCAIPVQLQASLQVSMRFAQPLFFFFCSHMADYVLNQSNLSIWSEEYYYCYTNLFSHYFDNSPALQAWAFWFSLF